MAAQSLLTELRRRNVIRMAGLYLVGAWLLVQVAGTVLPMFGAPAWMPRSVVVLLALGFVPALAFSWIFELTPDGLKRDAEVKPEESIARQTARRMEHTIVAVLFLAVLYFVFDKFVLAPARIATATTAATTAAAAAPKPAAGANSIAVLPFVDMSQGKDQEYFSDGLSEQLLNELAQIPGLHVAGRTSSFYFKGRNEDLRSIGRKLNVATVLEGSVARSGDTLRVTAQLINAADGYHLWSHTYDREFKDVFALQDEIAAAVVAALKLKLLPGQAPHASHRVDPVAYNEYLLARNFTRNQNLAGWTRAEQALRKALALQPDYAAAQAELAQVMLQRSYYNDAASKVLAVQAEAMKAAEQAVAMDPTLAAGYRVRAQIRSEALFDWAGGVADIERAIELSPGDPVILAEAGRLFVVLRRFEDAQRVLDRALENDPLSTDALLSMAELQMARGKQPLAREFYSRILEIAPDSSYANSGLVQAWLLDGKPQEALAALRGGPEQPRTLYSQAMIQHSLGHRAESDSAVEGLIRNHAAGWAYQVGVIYAWRGEYDQAIEWFERGIAQQDGGMLRMDTEPMVAGLRKDPRYPALRKKVGFPE